MYPRVGCRRPRRAKRNGRRGGSTRRSTSSTAPMPSLPRSSAPCVAGTSLRRMSARAGDRAGPGRDTMTTGPTPALMKQINEAFNSRDVDRIMSFFAEDCTFLMARGPEPEGRRVHGKAAVRKVLGDRFRVITDMRWDHVDSFVTGNRAVTVWRRRREAELPRLRPLRVSRRQGTQQGHLLETGGAPGPPLSTGLATPANPFRLNELHEEIDTWL